MPTASEDYQRIAAAINFIAENRLEQPELATVAAAVGLSKYHFQRLFVRWAGISPKQFLAHLTVGHAKELLRQGESVLHASLDTGLSGPGRLHDLFVGVEAMTPGDYKRFGADLMIRYGLQQTPFGDALVLLTERGVCGFEFVDDSDGEALDAARAEWPLSEFVADQGETAAIVARLFAPDQARPALLLRGSRFQTKVWSALLQLPEGQTVSDGGLASAIGAPGAARAVGQAVAHNPLALLVPCHRVLKQNGAIEGYRWGDTRKRALLAWEAVRSEELRAA